MESFNKSHQSQSVQGSTLDDEALDKMVELTHMMDLNDSNWMNQAFVQKMFASCRYLPEVYKISFEIKKQ